MKNLNSYRLLSVAVTYALTTSLVKDRTLDRKRSGVLLAAVSFLLCTRRNNPTS